MRRPLYVFAWTFGLSASVAAATGGCGVEDCQHCTTPTRPDGERTYTVNVIQAYDATDTEFPFARGIQHGVVDIDETTVHFEYDRGGAHHVVEYDVLANDAADADAQ